MVNLQARLGRDLGPQRKQDDGSINANITSGWVCKVAEADEELGRRGESRRPKAESWWP